MKVNLGKNLFLGIVTLVFGFSIDASAHGRRSGSKSQYQSGSSSSWSSYGMKRKRRSRSGNQQQPPSGDQVTQPAPVEDPVVTQPDPIVTQPDPVVTQPDPVVETPVENPPADSGSSVKFASVQEAFNNSCVGCHSSYSSYEGIKNDISRIKSASINGGHGGFSADQKTLITNWINAGMLNQ